MTTKGAILAAFLLLTFAVSADAIECYYCTSEDEGCSTPARKAEWGSINQNLGNVSFTVCNVYIQLANDKTTMAFIRSGMTPIMWGAAESTAGYCIENAAFQLLGGARYTILVGCASNFCNNFTVDTSKCSPGTREKVVVIPYSGTGTTPATTRTSATTSGTATTIASGTPPTTTNTAGTTPCTNGTSPSVNATTQCSSNLLGVQAAPKSAARAAGASALVWCLVLALTLARAEGT